MSIRARLVSKLALDRSGAGLPSLMDSDGRDEAMTSATLGSSGSTCFACGSPKHLGGLPLPERVRDKLMWVTKPLVRFGVKGNNEYSNSSAWTLFPSFLSQAELSRLIHVPTMFGQNVSNNLLF